MASQLAHASCLATPKKRANLIAKSPEKSEASSETLPAMGVDFFAWACQISLLQLAVKKYHQKRQSRV